MPKLRMYDTACSAYESWQRQHPVPNQYVIDFDGVYYKMVKGKPVITAFIENLVIHHFHPHMNKIYEDHPLWKSKGLVYITLEQQTGIKVWVVYYSIPQKLFGVLDLAGSVAGGYAIKPDTQGNEAFFFAHPKFVLLSEKGYLEFLQEL